MDKKEQIMLKAMELFVNQGFENTSTSQISKESKAATGTMFHHFKTKEELVMKGLKCFGMRLRNK